MLFFRCLSFVRIASRKNVSGSLVFEISTCPVVPKLIVSDRFSATIGCMKISTTRIRRLSQPRCFVAFARNSRRTNGPHSFIVRNYFFFLIGFFPTRTRTHTHTRAHIYTGKKRTTNYLHDVHERVIPTSTKQKRQQQIRARVAVRFFRAGKWPCSRDPRSRLRVVVQTHALFIKRVARVRSQSCPTVVDRLIKRQ